MKIAPHSHPLIPHSALFSSEHLLLLTLIFVNLKINFLYYHKLHEERDFFFTPCLLFHLQWTPSEHSASICWDNAISMSKGTSLVIGKDYWLFTV